MKTVCAACGVLISAECPHCHAPLVPIAIATGQHFQDPGAMLCTNDETPICYSRAAIDRMESANALCPACFAAGTANKKRGPTPVHKPATTPAPEIERDLDNEGQ